MLSELLSMKISLDTVAPMSEAESISLSILKPLSMTKAISAINQLA